MFNSFSFLSFINRHIEFLEYLQITSLLVLNYYLIIKMKRHTDVTMVSDSPDHSFEFMTYTDSNSE